MDIADDQLYHLFLQSRNLKPRSIERYQSYLTSYSNFFRKNAFAMDFRS